MRSFLRPLSLKMAITISLVIWFSLTPQIVELVLAASPSLDLNGDEETIFYQLGGPVPIDIDMTLEDDDDELYSIKVEILNIQDPGEEIILAKESNKVRIDSVEDGSNGVLTLSGTGNVIHYNSLLEGLQYQHTGEITSTVDRSIRITVNDGTNTDSATTSVAMEKDTHYGEVRFENNEIEIGDVLFIVVNDDDENTHDSYKDTVIVELRNLNTDEDEEIEVEESSLSSGFFSTTFPTVKSDECTDAQLANNSGELCVNKNHEIRVRYIDEVDDEGKQDKTRTDHRTVIKEATTTVVPISEEIDTSPCTEIEKDQYAFPDICKHTLSDYIENLYDLGVVNGFDNGMFKPEEPVTRGQMATFITRAFKLSVDTSGNCFSDVPDDYPHKLDIQALCNVEIVQGYGDGTFRPDNPLKRGEATKFIALTMFQKGYDITTYEDHSFPDVLEGNPFNPYISFLSGITINDAKVINGYSSGEFGPDDSMTRAQMAKVVSLSIDYTP